MYLYIYIYREREREIDTERERERERDIDHIPPSHAPFDPLRLSGLPRSSGQVASEPPGRSDPILGSATGGDLLGFATKSGGKLWKNMGTCVENQMIKHQHWAHHKQKYIFFLRKMRMNH